MSECKYESKITSAPCSAAQIYRVLSNLENLRPIIQAAQDNDMLRQQMEQAGQDPSVLEKLKDVQLTEDYIGIPAPMVGEISMRIIEREENKTIKFATDQSPVDANMWIQVLPTTAAVNVPVGVPVEPATKMRLTLKADLNPMIKMMVGSKLKDGIDKFADMLAMIKY